jgi:hypothetical protein
MLDYGYTLHQALHEPGLPAMMVIYEARAERVNPGSGPTFVDRLAMDAMATEEANLRRQYKIIP